MKNLLSKNIIFMMSLLFSLTLITSCGDDEDGGTDPMPANPSSPVANFSSQVNADNSLTYTFTNNSVVNNATDNSFTSAWDFGGDGTSDSNEMSFDYTFSAEGSYDVTLTITAADGEEDSTTQTIEVTAPRNRYASITDSSGDNTGELRLGGRAIDSIRNGVVTFNFRVSAGPSDDIQDGFINVTGTSTSGRNSIVEIRLKDDQAHSFREGASDATIAAADGLWPEGAPDVWIPVQISWASDGVSVPTYSVSIDGQDIIMDAPSTTRDPNNADQVMEHLDANINGAHNIQWKYASNSAISDGFFHVDDIVVWSLDSGTQMMVFEDNFQGRAAGDDLNPGTEDDPTTIFHENTFDATVGEDQ